MQNRTHSQEHYGAEHRQTDGEFDVAIFGRRLTVIGRVRRFTKQQWKIIENPTTSIDQRYFLCDISANDTPTDGKLRELITLHRLFFRRIPISITTYRESVPEYVLLVPI